MKPFKIAHFALLGALCAQFFTTPLAARQGQLVFTEESQPVAQTEAATTSMIPPLSYVAHLPGAKTTGAPSWVKEGARITRWSGDATVQGNPNMTTMVADANGTLVDANGNRFRQSTAGAHGGAGGVGLVQLDIIYTGMGMAVIDMRQYLGDGREQALTPQGELKSENLNPGSNLYWVHPSLLAQCKPADHGSFKIMTGKWTLPNNRTFDAVIFTETSANYSGHLVYDKESGVCLSHGNRSKSTRKHTGYDPSSGRYGNANTMNTHLSESYFLGIRQKNLPWAGAKMISGEKFPKQFNFAGPSTFEGAGGVGGPMTTFNIHEAVQFQGAAPGAFLTSITRTYQGLQGAQPEQRLRYHASNQIGGFYVSPKVLTQLRPSQVVDHDPITNVKTVIEFKGRADNGIEVIAITEQCPGGSTARWAYELRTGFLLGYAEVLVMPDGMSVSSNLMERQVR